MKKYCRNYISVRIINNELSLIAIIVHKIVIMKCDTRFEY